MEKRLAAVVFSDLKAYSELNESEVVRFSTLVLPECVRLAKRRDAMTVNTWSDAVVALFSRIQEAVQYCFGLSDYFRNRNWSQRWFRV